MTKLPIALVALCLAFTGCQTPGSGKTGPERLHAAFVSADSLERATILDLGAWHKLKQFLFAQMHKMGDARFADALSKETDGVRESVVNCMGCERADFLGYPKTLYVLEATPKI